MVRNMEESLRFYEDIIGLSVVRRFASNPDREIAFLGDGETQVELIYDAAKQDTNVGNDISWGFKVESLDDCMTLILEKGFQICRGPFQPNPHTRFFYVKDPNGMTIQFVETK